MIDDELKKYIPRFLPDGEQVDFFSDLKQLISKEMGTGRYKNFYATYGTKREPYLDQGDCIDGIPVYNLPNLEYKEGKVFILSNTCDVNTENVRVVPMKVMYAPILNLDKYIDLLKSKGGYSEKKIEAIRDQQVTNLFYLPDQALGYEAIVPLDHINSLSSDLFEGEKITKDRLFQLSRSGWYTLLVKITHHFARANEELMLNRSPRTNP